MAGKDADGRPLQGHQHAEFFVWYEAGSATRLLVWRDGRPFDVDETRAMLAAAAQELSWAAPGDDADAWKVRLIPLTEAVAPPPGFDGTLYRVWESVTPYVPPRHYLRGGKPREQESIENQVRRELRLRKLVREVDGVKVSVLEPQWVAVHLPRARRNLRAFLGDCRGYRLRVELPEPVSGPLRLGHSSSFGLGLFRPEG
jgi:CRISPR-associated protein Csb2